MKKNIAFIIILLMLLTAKTGFSQDQNFNNSGGQKETGELLKEAFEKAMRNVEAEKAKVEENKRKELEASLEKGIVSWIRDAENTRRQQLNKFVPQNWWKFSKIIDIDPVPKDYYLRDFRYAVNRIDIVKTESIANPYKASVSINEILFVELYHSPSISYRNMYFYTITIPLQVDFEYRGSEFFAFGSSAGTISISQGVPQEIEAKIIRQTFN